MCDNNSCNNQCNICVAISLLLIISLIGLVVGAFKVNALRKEVVGLKAQVTDQPGSDSILTLQEQLDLLVKIA